VDILAEHDRVKVAIEQDGAYRHSPEAKILVHQCKSRDLIAAGYLVARLREDGLPPLGIDDARYLEVPAYSIARPALAMDEVAQRRQSLLTLLENEGFREGLEARIASRARRFSGEERSSPDALSRIRKAAKGSRPVGIGFGSWARFSEKARSTSRWRR
jgi:hypothetical protein